MARLVLLALALAGCASPPAYGCTTAIDTTGRGIPVCSSSDQVPVCDASGEMAHFTGASTASLEGGTFALCDSSNQIVCMDRTVLPHCIARPVAGP